MVVRLVLNVVVLVVFLVVVGETFNSRRDILGAKVRDDDNDDDGTVNACVDSSRATVTRTAMESILETIAAVL